MYIPHVLGFAIVQGVGKKSIMIVQSKRLYVVKKTKYQEVVIADLEDFGKSLVLDGYIQSSLVDEYIYHESLVHPAMVVHPNPRNVLIIGGGEGATLREVLKHRCVERVTMVDIDGEVVELSKRYLPEMHKGAFDDPRAKVVIGDGREYLMNTKEEFDVIILDLTDPYSSDIAKQLYTREFYEKVFEKLRDPGVMVTQAGNSFFFEDVYESIVKAIKDVFPKVLEYHSWIPSFGYSCNFVMATKGVDPFALTEKEVDSRLRERNVVTRYFTGRTFIAMINAPIVLRSGVRFNVDR